MDIITTKGTIYITDQARSSYEIISDEGDYNSKADDGTPFRSHTWKCTDERNRKVYFKISKYDDNPDTFFTVMYDDVLFRYYVALSGGIDRLN